MSDADRAGQRHFDSLYAHRADPWDTAASWYERRKRAIIAAILPQQRFAHIYEPGCGSGEMTLALASRCERLHASDFSDPAVRITRDKTSHLPHVDVRQESLPGQWPALSAAAPPFDLIVLAELCYYLDPPQLTELTALAVAGLAPGGHMLACHWKKEFDDRLQPTDAMHRLIDANGRLRHTARYEDDDFLLDLWRKT
ncbi:class I SAM-dependent methyltransferase [Herbaspirillum sp. WKF16]|uniref:class I SAM-dependent methyltransferase n=1 Tax=Herbaspirillum sp. WKF16 TaxID=3028312 RepID=UPI0023A9E750|nr:class I SAM-dependent methyltransferase [Herbaspirillum sp. WKF16]WDZ97382.1 class I SAM-dependent methyltransferase [Herbaspirillum sp. WKF16]